MAKGSGGTKSVDKTHNSSPISKATQSGYEAMGGGAEGRTMQAYMAKIVGFDKKPTLVSESQFVKLQSDPNYIILYRGYRNNEEKNISDYKIGDYYSGHGGAGDGAYFSTQKLMGFSATGKFIEGALSKKSSKIGEYSVLESQWLKEKAEYSTKFTYEKYSKLKTEKERKDFSLRSKAYDNFGSWATLKGYDAVHSNLLGNDEYIVYNRSKMKVKK